MKEGEREEKRVQRVMWISEPLFHHLSDSLTRGPRASNGSEEPQSDLGMKSIQFNWTFWIKSDCSRDPLRLRIFIWWKWIAWWISEVLHESVSGCVPNFGAIKTSDIFPSTLNPLYNPLSMLLFPAHGHMHKLPFIHPSTSLALQIGKKVEYNLHTETNWLHFSTADSWHELPAYWEAVFQKIYTQTSFWLQKAVQWCWWSTSLWIPQHLHLFNGNRGEEISVCAMARHQGPKWIISAH